MSQIRKQYSVQLHTVEVMNELSDGPSTELVWWLLHYGEETQIAAAMMEGLTVCCCGIEPSPEWCAAGRAVGLP